MVVFKVSARGDTHKHTYAVMSRLGSRPLLLREKEHFACRELQDHRTRRNRVLALAFSSWRDCGQ